jgi:hypothetical protein
MLVLWTCMDLSKSSKEAFLVYEKHSNVESIYNTAEAGYRTLHACSSHIA